jgi:hypothetical protein
LTDVDDNTQDGRLGPKGKSLLKKNVRIVVVSALLAVTLYALKELVCDHFKERKAAAIRVQDDLGKIPHSDIWVPLIGNESSLTERGFAEKDYFELYFYKNAGRLIDEMDKVGEIVKRMKLPPHEQIEWDKLDKIYLRVADEPKRIDESKESPAIKLQAARHVLTSAENIHAVLIVSSIDRFNEIAKQTEERADHYESICTWGAFFIFVLGVVISAVIKGEAPEIG